MSVVFLLVLLNKFWRFNFFFQIGWWSTWGEISTRARKKSIFFVSSDDTLEKKRAAASGVKCVHSEKKLYKSLSNSVVARVDELRLARRSDSTLKVACSYQHNVASISNIEKKKVPLPPSASVRPCFIVRKRRLVVKDLRMPLGATTFQRPSQLNGLGRRRRGPSYYCYYMISLSILPC